MRSTLCGLMFCAVAPLFAAAQVNELATAFQQPGARLQWSQEMGRLESGASRMVLTGVAVATSAQPEQRIRGLQIDFLDSGDKSTVYLDEKYVSPLKAVLDQLSLDLQHRQPHQSSRLGESYLGSCEFRDHPENYPVQVAYCVSGGCGPGLQVTSPTRMKLAGRTPFELSAILAHAVEQLREH